MSNSKKIKKFFYLLAVVALIVGIQQVIQLVNYVTIDDELEPIMFVDSENSEFMFYHFQKNKENKTISLQKNSRIDGRYYDLDRNKKEVLMQIYDYSDKEIWIVKFNYISGEIDKLFTYEDLKGIQQGNIEELHFIPNSNDVSFIIDDVIGRWDYEKKQCIKIYTFNDSCFGKLGFAYKWKNNEEMYLVESDDLILYNINSKNKEIIIEDIGKVYFQMSGDNEYIIWQKQWGERREVMLMNIQTKEQKKIHMAKSNYKVRIYFSPNNEYIFLRDTHRDNQLGIRYWYLYDMKRNRKFSIDVDCPKAGIVGW